MTEADRACILIIENDVLVRNLVSTVLSNAGHHVLAAANDAEAIQLSRTFPGEIRLLIARRSAAAGTIAAERPPIRIIFLSPHTGFELKETVRSVDPAVFLGRPILPPKMTDCIKRALDGVPDGSAEEV